MEDLPLRLHIETFGHEQYPAVILLHGLLGAARNLRRLASAIADSGFFVITYDQRGHGHSPWSPPGKGYSFEILAQDAFAVLDHYHKATAHFIGHSMGGRVSLAAWGVAPQRMLSLALLDVGPHLSESAYRSLKDIVDPLPAFFRSKQAAESALAPLSPQMKLFLLSNLRTSASNQEATWVFDLVGLRLALSETIRLDQSDLFQTITIPTLMLRGENSDHFTAEELAKSKKLNSRIETQTITGAAHWLHADQFEATRDALMQWLDRQK